MAKWCSFCEQRGIRRIAYRTLADGRGMCGGCLADTVWMPQDLGAKQPKPEQRAEYTIGDIQMKTETHRRGSMALSIVRKFFPNVEKVQDATEDLTVEVNANDVRNSQRKEHNNCAMAVACIRSVRIDGAIISTSKAYLIKGNIATRFNVPESVAREVVAFDRSKNFQPGKYRLNKITGTERLGHQTGSHRRPTTGRSISRQHLTENIRIALNKN